MNGQAPHVAYVVAAYAVTAMGLFVTAWQSWRAWRQACGSWARVAKHRRTS